MPDLDESPADPLDDKPVAASAKRIAEARRAGVYPSSPALAAALVLIAGWAALSFGARAVMGTWVAFFRRSYRPLDATVSLRGAFTDAATTSVAILVLPLVTLGLLAILLAQVQSRGRWWPPRAERRRSWSSRCRARLVERGKGLAALLALSGVLYGLLVPLLRSLPGLWAASPARVFSGVVGLVGHLWFRLSLAALVLGLADILWRRHAQARALRMSHHELEQEHKEMEGDPAPKAERRRLQHAMLQDLGAIADATLVVTDSASAIAISYDGKHAPRLAARAYGTGVARLLLVARSAAVPVIVALELMPALAAVKVGEAVPAALEEALARLFVEAGLVADSATKERTSFEMS